MCFGGGGILNEVWGYRRITTQRAPRDTGYRRAKLLGKMKFVAVSNMTRHAVSTDNCESVAVSTNGRKVQKCRLLCKIVHGKKVGIVKFFPQFSSLSR